jgi:uncharacterized protein (UPF0332 family)
MNTPEELQPLLADRLQRANETLMDAQLLLRHGGSPISVINRSYYAMFYATQALMAKREIPVSKHSGVIAQFDQGFVKTGVFAKSMSRALHRAFDFRQIGDYREMFEITQQQAEEILQEAEQFIQAIVAYFSDPPTNSPSKS